MIDTISEIKRCRCGYHVIVYTIEHIEGKPPHYHYFDGHSGDYRQCYVCPGCHDRLDHNRLEG